MQARIKKLFSRTFSAPQSDLEGLNYENTIPQKSPVRGFGIRDPNSYNEIKRHSRIPSIAAPIAEEAALSDGPRGSHWSLETDAPPRRPRSFDPLHRRSKNAGRTFSGFSMKSPPSLGKRRSKQSIRQELPVPPIPVVPAHARQSPSIDIFHASSGSLQTVGRRDYGEDVADRNMRKDGGSRHMSSKSSSNATFALDSEEFSYLRSLYVREKAKARDDLRISTSAPSWDVLRERDIDDDVLPTSPLSPRPSPSPTTTVISGPRNNNKARKKTRSEKKASPIYPVQEEQFSDHNAIFVSTTRRTSIASSYQVPSKPTEDGKPGIPARSQSRTYSLPSANKYSETRGLARDAAPRTKRVLSRSHDKSQWFREDVENDLSDSGEQSTPRRSPVKEGTQAFGANREAATATVAVTRDGQGSLEEGRRVSPLLKPLSELDTNQPDSLPLKPITTAINKQPHTSVLDPKPPKHVPGSSVSSVATHRKNRSKTRTASSTYGPFPNTNSSPRPAYSRRNSSTSSDALGATPKQIKRAPSRSVLAMDGSSELPSHHKDLDLGYTADTEIQVRASPAVTHDTVIPRVHHVRDEHITREIHTHDVFHRVQPVIQTEVLPAKHYIHDEAGHLVEIPAEAVPRLPGHWQAHESPRSSASSMDSCVPPSIPTGRYHRGASLSSQQRHSLTGGASSDPPLLSSTRASTMTSAAAPRTESIWRHRPSLEPGNSAAALPDASERYLDPYAGDETDTSQSCRSEDSVLLFRNNGYGSGAMSGNGMLPGLL